MSDDRGVTSSQGWILHPPARVMPTLGKGTLGTWRFHQCSVVPDTEPEPHRFTPMELGRE
jgi:hypothetical protein